MLIVKIGGGKDINAEGIISDLSELDEEFIIVHGANAYRDEIAERLGQPKKTITSVSGYESVYSDEDAIDVLMMAYSGLRNKRIVELCQRNGINAVGLSGLDGQVIQGRRNKGIKAMKDDKTVIMRDYSGKPEELNEELLSMLLENGYTPVLCVPISDEKGFAINADNDNVVNALQEAFGAESIIQFIEAPGLMENVDDPDSLIEEMSINEIRGMEEEAEGRIKRKLLSLRRLLENDAAEVVISDGRTDHPVRDALDGAGTVIG